MSTAGTTIELALSALFELCVPAVSFGIFEQSFPADLVVPITEDDRAAYNVSETEAYRIDSPDGFVLFYIEGGSCRIVTGDGDPALIRELFLARLPDEGAHLDPELSRDHEPNGIVARLPLSRNQFILIILFPGQTAGFYGSAQSYTLPE